MGQEVVVADVIEWAKTYEGAKFHALLCDPPYHLTSIVKRFGSKTAAPAQQGSDGRFSRLSRGFMGQEWDGGDVAFRPETWAAIGQHLLPGAHLLAFGGTRTWHRLTVAIEDAGFELRDTLMWLYGSGFPKSHDVSKGLDKAAGAERKVVGRYVIPADSDAGNAGKVVRSVTAEGGFGGNITAAREGTSITAPATDAARQWEGYGTALKPAWEPIIVARKPLEGTVAQNCLKHGCGALNIDGCRVEGGERPERVRGDVSSEGRPVYGTDFASGMAAGATSRGRWPANLILSHDPRCKMVGERRVRTGTAVGDLHNASGTNAIYARMRRKGDQPDHGYGDKDGMETVEVWECVEGCPVGMFPNARSSHGGGQSSGKRSSMFGIGDQGWNSHDSQYYDSGSAARFFYTSKASKAERNKGTDGCDHPTVKPLDLLRYLSLLILPPPLDVPRRILVPFAGVGSEMIGARQAGWDEVLGIEISQHYADIAAARLAAWLGML